MRSAAAPKLRGALILLAALATTALGLGACGSGGPSEKGVLRGTYTVFPDSLDPGRGATIEAWTALYNTYIPLLTYAHADGAAGTKVIPGLARDLPQVSADGRTYTLFLRPGLEYSNGRPVRASDFSFTIERLFLANSPGSVFFEDVVGAERFARAKSGGISGIEDDDATGTIRIHLARPRGTFVNELASLYGALLPRGTPTEDQTQSPPPATGPYEITEVHPGHSWTYGRNPAWDSTNGPRMPQIPRGHVNGIELSVVSNPATQVREVERGHSEWMKNPPPPDLIASVERRYEGTQFRSDPSISVFYFWMNTTRPPFDDLDVRRAVNYAVNPAALERIYTGIIRRSQQVLPPGMPGHRHFELYPYDLRKAKRLIAKAHPKDRHVTVWGISLPPNQEAAEYYAGVLNSLGFETKLKTINAETYFGIIGNASTPDLDTGYANWLEEYPHPNDFFEPQLTGGAILPINNYNYSHFNDPSVDAKVDELVRQSLGPRQEAEYAALDEAVMRQAPWAPFGTLIVPTFVSSAIDLDEVVVSPIFGQDLSSFEFDESQN